MRSIYSLTKVLVVAVALVTALVSCSRGVDPDTGGTGNTAQARKPLLFRTHGAGFQILPGDEWRDFWMNGINFGLARPGLNPGDLPRDRPAIARWLEYAGELGTNTIRLYTLQTPEFYDEVARYQARHPDRPLWVVQGIWFDELDVTDYFEQEADFQNEMRVVIDAIHGEGTIGERYGKAYGTYTADVSNYVIAYLIGRELSPYVVEDTNEAHVDDSAFEGDYCRTTASEAMDVLVCRAFDEVLRYSQATYGTQRPVGWSNWPTLDPLYHPTEPHDRLVSAEDFVAVDTAQFQAGSANKVGFFASFHAYPYFPEFIIYDPEYLALTDEYGPNPYLGYLYELRNHYAQMPLIIGEYGVPSSRGVAKYASSGLHHGGHSEIAQGLGNVRQLQTIRDAGCAGGILFALMDEWFKRSWVVESLELPPERRHLWHNVMNPEENFGLLAMDPDFPGTRVLDGATDDWDGAVPLAEKDGGLLHALYVSHDAAYVFVRIDVDPSVSLLEDHTLYLGIDTIDAALGDSRFPDGLDASSSHGLEFVVKLGADGTSELLVDTSYDPYGQWHGVLGPAVTLRPESNDDGLWASLRAIVNFEAFLEFEPWRPRLEQHIGALRRGTDVPSELQYDSLADYALADGLIELRIPWALLNVTDPTRREVLFDNLDTPETERRETPGFHFVAVLAENAKLSVAVDRLPKNGPSEVFAWETWETPTFRERVKDSYALFQAGIATLGLRAADILPLEAAP